MIFKKHLIEYIFIFLYFSFLIYFFNNLSLNSNARLIFAASLPTFYLLWAVAHHFFEERLKLHVFLEYLSISLFVFIILLTASNI
jgi:hypothetical protein